MTAKCYFCNILIRAILVAAALAMPVVALGASEDGADRESFLFYPSPPNKPRLQFLTSFSSALDLSSKNKGFRDFVFGGEENESDLVNKPYGLAVHEGAIYAVDTRGNGWAVFDVGNSRSRIVKPGGGGSLKKPINIAIDDDGTKYVTDTGRQQILVYDSTDNFLNAFGEPGQFNPVDVAIANDRLFVTDIMNHRVLVLDKQTGEMLNSFGEAGSAPGQLYHPTNVAVAPDDTLYVVDTSNFRVQQFSAEGEFIRAIGQIGTGPGTFARPKGIALAREGYIYVVDAAFGNIQILDSAGGALMAFGRGGTELDSINLPTVVKIDYDNVSYFEKYAAPNFEIEYLVVVASQFGRNKVVVYGYGDFNE